jgi:hypothetical protein
MASKKSIRFALAIAGAVLLSGFHIGYLALVVRNVCPQDRGW